MVRHNVDSMHVQDFRRKVEAFGQRQSLDAAGGRKRTSAQAEQEIQRPALQRSTAWSMESDNAQFKRPKTLMAQRGNVSLDRISNFALPSPAGTEQDQYFPDMMTSLPLRDGARRPSHISFADVEFHDLEPSYEHDLETPADQPDGFDFASDTSSNASERSGTEPSTPDGPTFGLQAPDGGFGGFIDLSFLSEHERNLVIAMADRQKQGAEHLPVSSYDDFAYAAKFEVAQPSAEDFEAAFIEFMNVT